jgi:hypothetical protein
MSIENADLERRVLAHEQILQALMAQLAEGEPGFLDRMLERFASARRGAHEHDYVETADYAEALLHEVMHLRRMAAVKPTASRPAPAREVRGAEPQNATPRTTMVRTARSGGVWHVTCDDVFLGDYHAEGPLRAAAAKAVRDIVGRGGRAELIVEAGRQPRVGRKGSASPAGSWRPVDRRSQSLRVRRAAPASSLRAARVRFPTAAVSQIDRCWLAGVPWVS